MPPTFELAGASIRPHEVHLNGVAIGFEPRLYMGVMIMLNESSVMPLIGRNSESTNGQDWRDVIDTKQLLEFRSLVWCYERILEGAKRDSKNAAIDGSADRMEESACVFTLWAMGV